MNKMKHLSGVVFFSVLLGFAGTSMAQYSGSLFGPINIDDGTAVSGLSASSQAPTTNGQIRYQWSIVPTTSGDNRWLGFEWDSRSRQFAFYGNPTFTLSDNVQISASMDIGGSAYGWGAIGNTRFNGVETTKRVVFNIVDSGTTLSTAPGNDQIQFSVTELNHVNAVVNLNDNSTNGMTVTRSGNTLTLSVGTHNAESSGSTEELWYQWTHDTWTTRNFIEDTAIAANETTTINLSSSAPILREGDTLLWNAGIFGPLDLATISATYSNTVGFDVANIRKTRVVQHLVTDDDTTAPTLSAFSLANRTDGEILAGGYTISGSIQDSVSGVNNAGVTVSGNDFSPNFDILNNANTVVVSDQLFTTRPSDGTTTLSTLSAAAPAFAAASIDLGTYKVRVSAEDNDEDPTTASNDGATVIDSQVATFTVTDDDTAAPVPSAFSVNGGADVTDGQIFAGGYTISGTLTDTGSGINNNGATVTTDNFSPNFDILNNANTELSANQLFTTRPADGASGTASAAAPAIAANVDLGTYKIRVSVTDNDEDRSAVNDRSALVDNQVVTFTVTDDDTTGPTLSSVQGNAITLSGANYLDTDLASGLALSMSVSDAQSGVEAGTASRYGLARDGAGVATGTLTPGFASGANGTLTATIAAGSVQTVGSYTLYVTNRNNDLDRGATDQESSVNTYSFTVYANTPVITVQAGTLAFGSLVVNGTSSEQSYTVSGINLGTDPIVITAPSGFQVSTTSGSGFGSSVNLTPSGGTVGSTTIYVRFVPNNVASFSANITHTHTSAATQNKAVTGTGTAPSNPSAFSATGGSLQNTLTFTRNAALNPVTIVRNTSGSFTTPSGAPPAPGNAFAGGTVVYNGGTSPQTDTGLAAGTLYYYRAFSYDSVGNFYSSGSDANATTIPAAPSVSADSSRSLSGFTANWSASAGATSYRLDVSSQPDFSVMLSGYDNLTVVGTSQSVTIPGDNDVGNYYYRVRAVNTSGTSGNSATQSGYTTTAQGRNGGFGSTPPATVYYTPATIYVGDTATFGLHTWGTVAGNFGRHRVVIDTDANLVVGGLRGSFSGFDNAEYNEATSPTFTSVGTWYWGMQIDYGTPYGTNFWMVRDSSGWADLYYAGTNANLTVTVLQLENPSGVNAVKDGTFPSERIDLSWTKWNSRDVMVVRSLDASFTAPTPGQTYTAGNTIGGDTVVYEGAGTTFEDTGLSANTTYYYRYYSENNGYYSAGADDSETTDPSAIPAAPVATAASGVGYTSFTANWNASPGATSYRIDVSRNASFTHLVVDNHNPGNVTSYAVSGFGTGHYYYRVRAVNGAGTSDNSNVIEIGTLTAQTRNTGAGSPQVTAGTIYVGDTVTFGLDSWADMFGNFGRARVWIHTSASLGSGTAGDWGGFVNTLNKTRTRQMTTAGTLYWGIQMDYGSPYGTNFWYVRDSSAYYNMHFNPTGAALTVTVTALGDPTGIGSTVVGQNQINLSWTKWNNRDVMIVRSLDNSFGTPTPGQTYIAGNTIAGDTVIYKGAGTSFNDTGLTQSTTYYYRFYSENFGYYSSGTVDSDTTLGDVPLAPVATAASSVLSTSFSANWNASVGATSYRLDVSTANNFSSFVGSYNNLNVGNVTTYAVSGLTGGQTYYFRVRAVNGSGPSADSNVITVILPSTTTVAIEEIPEAAPSQGTVTFAATVGATYQVYSSDDDGATWNFVSTVIADSNPETAAVTEDAKRHFKVVVSGQTPAASPSPAWGVVQYTIPAGYSLGAVPLDLTDLTLSGDFGTRLKEGLANGSQVYFRESNGSWTIRTLSGGNWSANYTMAEGQGYYIYNAGSEVTQRYDGPVGNNGVGNRTISTGWNIIGPSQGKTRTFSQITSALSGTPAGGWEESTADLIVIDEGNGNFHRIMKYNGSPSWLSLKTFGTPNVSIEPGQGIYYMKQSGSGVGQINF